MQTIKHIAYHEAGHAVAQYVLGHYPTKVIIIKNKDVLGSASHLDGDDLSVEGITDLVINLYAGAEAEKLVSDDMDVIKGGAL